MKKYLGPQLFIAAIVVINLILDIATKGEYDLVRRSGTIVVSICLLYAAVDIASLLRKASVNRDQVTIALLTKVEGKTEEQLAQTWRKRQERMHILFYSANGILGTILQGYGDLIAGAVT